MTRGRPRRVVIGEFRVVGPCGYDCIGAFGDRKVIFWSRWVSRPVGEGV
jgi:hypothetical protein